MTKHSICFSLGKPWPITGFAGYRNIHIIISTLHISLSNIRKILICLMAASDFFQVSQCTSDPGPWRKGKNNRTWAKSKPPHEPFSLLYHEDAKRRLGHLRAQRTGMILKAMFFRCQFSRKNVSLLHCKIRGMRVLTKVCGNQFTAHQKTSFLKPFCAWCGCDSCR